MISNLGYHPCPGAPASPSSPPLHNLSTPVDNLLISSPHLSTGFQQGFNNRFQPQFSTRVSSWVYNFVMNPDEINRLKPCSKPTGKIQVKSLAAAFN